MTTDRTGISGAALSRRRVLRIMGAGLGAWAASPLTRAVSAATADGPDAPRRPNVILIMTDDQGYGDVGAHGNPVIRTPNLDRLARESVEVDPFYVCPVCSPTRASLMTGRWNFRTGVYDTIRATMRTEEVTVAEVLAANGYRTGLFGKWHLGLAAPCRPMDQGFGESLWFLDGILGEGADKAVNKNGYFDPVLHHNDTTLATTGYCADVFTDAALKFIRDNRQQPFFVYLPFNTPHAPFRVPEKYSKPYEGIKPEDFPKTANPRDGVPATTACAYGMVANIDENLGRLFKLLEELKLHDDTIVMFLTDNGPNGNRWDAGLREYKGSPHEGGVRTTFFMRWPRVLKAGRKVTEIAAHIDVMPTLLEACGIQAPAEAKMDGRSFLALAKGERADWPNRNLYFQWHRGKPRRYLGMTMRDHRYKLVSAGKGSFGLTFYTPQTLAQPPVFELYDLQTDPREEKDIAARHPEIVARMKADYDRWFDEVTAGL